MENTQQPEENKSHPDRWVEWTGLSGACPFAWEFGPWWIGDLDRDLPDQEQSL